MKLFFGILFLASLANADKGFYCIPSLKQTGLQVISDGKTVSVSVRNPMGYEFMPQFEGPVTAQSIPLQKMQYEDLKKLGDGFTLQWPVAACQLDAVAKSIDCDGQPLQKISDIETNLVSTTLISEKSRGQSYDKQKYRFSFEKEGNFYFVSMEFYSLNCKSFDKASELNKRN